MSDDGHSELPGNAGPAASLDDVRRRLGAQLPNLIEAAAARYRKFAAVEPPADAKAFAAHSGACRAAIQHVDQLLKLARTIDGSGSAAVPEEDVETLIARAEAAIDEVSADI